MTSDPIRGSDETVRDILTNTRTWAVVGCSPDPYRASYGVAEFLKHRGYRIVPIHPGTDEILGERCYPDLASVPDDVEIDVVDIFRRSEMAGAHVDEAIAVGAKAVWMQLGVIDRHAAERGRAAGLAVVMDRCPKIELPRFAGRG